MYLNLAQIYAVQFLIELPCVAAFWKTAHICVSTSELQCSHSRGLPGVRAETSLEQSGSEMPRWMQTSGDDPE